MGWFIGLLGLAFGVYTHFTSRKRARLLYNVDQLSAFGLPEEFYESVLKLPLVLRLTNTGNKQAHNVVLKLRTSAPIESAVVDALTEVDLKQDGAELTATMSFLNPGDRLILKVLCTKQRGGEMQSAKLVKTVAVSSDDGQGVDRDSPDLSREALLAAGRGLKELASTLRDVALVGLALLAAFMVGIAVAPQVWPGLQDSLQHALAKKDTTETLPARVQDESLPALVVDSTAPLEGNVPAVTTPKINP